MLKHLFLLLSSLIVMGCANLKYSNMEDVRVENKMPNNNCKYVVQGSYSPTVLEGCPNWDNKRVTTFEENTVVIESTPWQPNGILLGQTPSKQQKLSYKSILDVSVKFVFPF